MSERYSRLFALPENLYAVGSPVVIAAGTLLKDTQTGRIVAQLKLRSISDKIIKAVKVKLYLYDTAGNSIDEPVVHDYLDLSISRDTEFAQKNPIPISNNTARSYKVSITEVVFAGQSVWAADNENWEPLSKPSLLTFDDPELQKQYQIKFGRNSKYEPKSEKDLWYCTCGALNHENEICHCCNNSLLALQTADMVTLKAEKDARLEDQARQAEARAKREADEKAARNVAAKEAKKKVAKTLKIVVPVVCALVAVVLLVINVIIPNGKYNDAVALMDAGQFEEAIAIFDDVGSYKDSEEKRVVCENAIIDAGFAKAEALLANGDKYHAAKVFYELRDYQDMWEYCMRQWGEITHRDTVSAGHDYIVGIKANGSLFNNPDLTDIVAVSVGKDYLDYYVTLRSDGTVTAFGFDDDNRCDVSNWTDIVAISAGFKHTVGLKADGTVVATQYTGNSYHGQCEVSDWTDIVAISAGDMHTVGLKADGTVVSTQYTGDPFYDLGQCEVSDWTDIVAISAGDRRTVGLKSDGTVVFAGSCNEELLNWTDIVAISAGGVTVGLKADGTVVYSTFNEDMQSRLSDLSKCTDIVAINADSGHIVGIKADGTAVAVITGNGDAYDVSDWTDIKLPD